MLKSSSLDSFINQRNSFVKIYQPTKEITFDNFLSNFCTKFYEHKNNLKNKITTDDHCILFSHPDSIIHSP